MMKIFDKFMQSHWQDLIPSVSKESSIGSSLQYLEQALKITQTLSTSTIFLCALHIVIQSNLAVTMTEKYQLFIGGIF
jgi:hypothetical protein